jgi:hypothetical protein
MTDTNNGWPGKPGVPLNPEKDGWHWLESIEGLVPALWAWPLWRHCRDFWDQRAPGWMEEQEWRYHGPVLMPDEATALQKRADQSALGYAREARKADLFKFLHKRDVAALQARVAELEAALQKKGCARDQKTTQYCAEVISRDARIAELEAALKGGKKDDNDNH